MKLVLSLLAAVHTQQALLNPPTAGLVKQLGRTGPFVFGAPQVVPRVEFARGVVMVVAMNSAITTPPPITKSPPTQRPPSDNSDDELIV